MPKQSRIQTVLVIGSGPIVIGQAAEFDYAGAQACSVLKEEGVRVVLVNSNPATIMTDKHLADAIYLEPLTVETITRIIEKERPDSLLAGLGGQTGLTLAMQLCKSGVLERYGVRLLGTSLDGIDRAEDRELFRNAMHKIGQPVVLSEIANTVEEAVSIAEQIGYPVIVRPAFTLGGSGSGIAADESALRVISSNGLELSPITQVLIEKCIAGWKEIEFETMRDETGEAVIVCSMENIDPVGVHTGDSIVAAPALTLTDREFSMLRQAALDIVGEIGIIGGCNCQFALKPDGSEYAVIEVNPRVSRSSALASKATGYPIAKITTKLALGYRLSEIANPNTGASLSGFEPAVDYIVVKYPKFPFEKFVGSSRRLGTQMKATGEVMSIAPTFEAALLKAVRGAEIGLDTLNAPPIDERTVLERLSDQDDRRLFTVFEAIKSGLSDEEIYAVTKIDGWFLQKLRNLATLENELSQGVTAENYHRAKQLGYTDTAIARISGEAVKDTAVFSYRIVKTCAAVFGTEKPYFYSQVGGDCEAASFTRSGKPVVMVLGSGPIRIGQGIEFDYSSVHCVWALKEMGYEVVIVNNNPETVSTDYDTADRLYFEPLCPEDVMNIIRIEKPVGVVVAFGGQTAIKLTGFLDAAGVPILGTSAEGIDLAEDRERFDTLLEQFNIHRPQGMGVKTEEEAVKAAYTLGFPVLLRPSYVIGGQNMRIVHSEDEVRLYMKRILSQGIDNPVLVDKYMSGIELEVDVISDGEKVLIPGIMQHIERAGVHSGDSIAVYPPYSINDKMIATIADCSEQLALALGTKGLVNIQYLIYQGELYVIEVNPRASRTVPYISKVTGVPMVDIASRIMLGERLENAGYGTGLYRTPPYFAVKVPVFSFEKLSDANSYLGPEMKSTGEVLGLGTTLNEALFKGMIASGKRFRYPTADKCIGVLLSVDSHDQSEVPALAKKLDDLGFSLFATEETAATVQTLGIDVRHIRFEESFDLLESGVISYVVYTGALLDSTVEDYMALSRKALLVSVPCFTSLDTAHAVADILASRFNEGNTELVDINAMSEKKRIVRFSKMQATGDDYIFIDNRDGSITCPEALCIALCDRHYGVGGDGIVLIEASAIADVKMRIFNRDGSEGAMAGNCIRSVGKYAYDNGWVNRTAMTVETASGIKSLKLYTRNGKVTLVSVNMGKADLSAASLPTTLPLPTVIDHTVTVGEKDYRITCVSVGNPHCVVFCDRVDAVDIRAVGPLFEHSPLFPERINTEFVRVVNKNMLKMRVWERGNGETLACGTGACAAVIAAVENGYCRKGEDITVKVKGGDLVVNYTDEAVTLTGDTTLVFHGEFEY